MSAPSKRSLLIELGTEELPPKSLDDLAAAFAAGVCEGLTKRGIGADVANAKTYCSPRRLAVLRAGRRRCAAGSGRPNAAARR